MEEDTLARIHGTSEVLITQDSTSTSYPNLPFDPIPRRSLVLPGMDGQVPVVWWPPLPSPGKPVLPSFESV